MMLYTKENIRGKREGKRQRPDRNGGFTLVEMIVVMAIIGILAGILVPSYLGYIEKTREKIYVVEARQLRTAVLAMRLEMEAAEGEESGIDIPEELFWEPLGSRENPLYGFVPSGWDPDGYITEITIEEDGLLTEITYCSPENQKETWILQDEDGVLQVEIRQK